jgi:peptide/nickel transport system ATP-binding protein/oligopeptide transport system ATP-binding protein
VVKYISDRIGVMYLGHLVETAPTETLFAKTLHPYTQALLSAVPEPDPHNKRKRINLEGDIPSPLNPPTGCVFNTRCPRAMPLCSRVVPVLKTQEDDGEHSIACHLYNMHDPYILKNLEEHKEASV